MKFDRQRLARTAMAKALQIRKRCGIDLWEATCVYDLAGRLGVDVRFIDIPSMEGAYCLAAHPTIIVSSLRPIGRQAYTAAHELGHHVFGHGDQYDELVDTRRNDAYSDPNEFTAECFAGVLLMPKMAIDRGFACRGLSPQTCKPEEAYVVAAWLGVGYTTLISHMQRTLLTLSQKRADDLLRYSPSSLRANLLGQECNEHLVVADNQWSGRAIDVQQSDAILLPPNITLEANCATIDEQTDTKTVVRATQPGIGRVHEPRSGWAAFIRVTRKNYVGRGKYRFVEEVSDVE
ncbi:MAG: ImmA/IrrE family metallo-endopeptidase [Sterolibacterium sp.]|jgi:hypothetical protein